MKNMNVGNKLVMLLFSDNTVFEKKMANIAIFSLNIVENSVNILEKVL